MKKFGIKEVVATGIGTALFIVLTEVQIPLGIIPNTSMQPRAAVLAFLAAVFGPCRRRPAAPPSGSCGPVNRRQDPSVAAGLAA